MSNIDIRLDKMGISILTNNGIYLKTSRCFAGEITDKPIFLIFDNLRIY